MAADGLEREVAEMLEIVDTQPERSKEMYCQVQQRLKEARENGQNIPPNVLEAEKTMRVVMCSMSQGR